MGVTPPLCWHSLSADPIFSGGFTPDFPTLLERSSLPPSTRWRARSKTCLHDELELSFSTCRLPGSAPRQSPSCLQTSSAATRHGRWISFAALPTSRRALAYSNTYTLIAKVSVPAWQSTLLPDRPLRSSVKVRCVVPS